LPRYPKKERFARKPDKNQRGFSIALRPARVKKAAGEESGSPKEFAHDLFFSRPVDP
jgi:hypothetical protein